MSFLKKILGIEKQTGRQHPATETLELQIEGMTCRHCEQTVMNTLNRLEGIVEKKVSYRDGKAKLKYIPEKISKEKIIGHLDSSPYKVKKDYTAASDAKPVILQSAITCPKCGHRKEETMPTDACQFFYQCENCKTVLKPKTGDCCVYCSYGTNKCPPMQQNVKNCC